MGIRSSVGAFIPSRFVARQVVNVVLVQLPQLLIPINNLSHRISSIVWTNGQENNCFIVLPLAPRVLTFLKLLVFLTNKKNHPKVSVHSRTAVTPQIESSRHLPETFCTSIGIVEDLFNPSPDALAQTRIACKVLDESLLINNLVLVFIHSRHPRG